jgi:hypothetical protein
MFVDLAPSRVDWRVADTAGDPELVAAGEEDADGVIQDLQLCLALPLLARFNDQVINVLYSEAAKYADVFLRVMARLSGGHCGSAA